MLGVSAILWIQILLNHGPLTLIPAMFGVVAVSLLAHELSQKLVARKLGLETTFKAWGSGLFFGWFLTLIGGFFPAYGSTYVKKLDWWYDPEKGRVGVFFAIGPLVSLTLAFAFWVMSTLTTSSLLVASAKVGYTINLTIVILNLIPIQAAGGLVWDGEKIFSWSKTVWITIVIATSALIILDALL